MRILYGVQGTGNGHITRARRLGPALEAQGVQVDYLFSGRDPSKYFNMEPFGDYQTRTGFTFNIHEGRVNPVKTLLNARVTRFIRDLWALDLSDYDLILSDFEPITAWAARLRGKRCIGIAHQYAFVHKVPGREHSRWVHLGIPLFTPVSDAVGLHWSHFGQPILPPMVAPLDQPLSSDPRRVLVYLPFEHSEQVIRFLNAWPSHEFHVFHELPAPRSVGNVHLHPLSRKHFKQQMAQCGGVFCNAGFGVCSEAIQGGKPLLVIPLGGQFEQAANAAALERLGLGAQMRSFDPARFERWLNSLNLSSSSSPSPWPATDQILARWIAGGCQESVHQLSITAWQTQGAQSSG